MSSLYLQFENLPTSILTYFYYFQFRIASFFHVTDQQAFGIALMAVLTALYLLCVILIGLRVFWKTRGRRAQTIRGDTILLLGPCDSGKTTFFYLTTQDELPKTVTSIKENVASFTCASAGEIDSKTVVGKIVDLPGHPSVRNQLEKYFPHACGIVFMLDGTNYNVKEIAEFLYDIFVSPSFVSHPCPLLLAVNKSDMPGCADNQTVFRQLEDELDLIKESRGSVESVGEKSINKLGVEGQKFSFEKDAPCKVYACNCCVKNRDILKVTGFIEASLH